VLTGLADLAGNYQLPFMVLTGLALLDDATGLGDAVDAGPRRAPTWSKPLPVHSF
jgi:hypothetical protein